MTNMRRLIALIVSILIAVVTGWAQSSMTDNQIMDYVIEQNARGVSRQQIVAKLMQRGVTIDQLRRIQKKYQKQIQNGALGAKDITADQPDFHLQPYDEVYVRRSPNYSKQQNITIEGEVLFEGTYTLTDKSQRLTDFIRLAGGLTGRAYPEGTKLLLKMNQEEREMMETVLRTAQRNSGKDSIDIRKMSDSSTHQAATPKTRLAAVARHRHQCCIPRHHVRHHCQPAEIVENRKKIYGREEDGC